MDKVNATGIMRQKVWKNDMEIKNATANCHVNPRKCDRKL